MKDYIKAEQALITLFLERVKRQRKKRYTPKSNNGKNYYYRTFSTRAVAKKMGVKMVKARMLLSKAESLNLVISERAPNWITWSPRKVEGFEEFEIKDALKEI